MIQKYNVCEIKDRLTRHGRVYDAGEEGLYCDWTMSGLSFVFSGQFLAVNVHSLNGVEVDPAPDGGVKNRPTWPVLAVYLDGVSEPTQIWTITGKTQQCLVFSSEKPETHTVLIRKITEAAKGKAAMESFLCDGEILAEAPAEKKLRIEFIGDSITCGFGDTADSENRLFYSEEENGALAHPAVAAEALDADLSVVACSGIALTPGIGAFEYPLKPMSVYYPYTDRFVEEAKELDPETYVRWDFASWRPDVIVLNLGTNDATVIDLNGDTQKGIEQFRRDYKAFIGMLRKCNGSEPWIICALGSMDYFLYDEIKEIVEDVCRKTGDKKLVAFKYGRTKVTEQLGACRHPSTVTQKRMGEEIAAFIKSRCMN